MILQKPTKLESTPNNPIFNFGKLIASVEVTKARRTIDSLASGTLQKKPPTCRVAAYVAYVAIEQGDVEQWQEDVGSREGLAAIVHGTTVPLHGGKRHNGTCVCPSRCGGADSKVA